MTNDAPTRAHIELVDSESITSQRAFIARNQSLKEETTDTVANADGTGVAHHKRPGTVVMYKPTERAGFVPRRVSAAAIDFLFKQGWSDVCPDCHGQHIKNGVVTTDPNACSARAGIAVRVCPVCQKRIYDNMAITSEQMASDDPNVINDDAYTLSDPAKRTKLKLDLHLWVRHPEWAQSNDVDPLPPAFKEMVDPGVQSRGT